MTYLDEILQHVIHCDPAIGPLFLTTQNSGPTEFEWIRFHFGSHFLQYLIWLCVIGQAWGHRHGRLHGLSKHLIIITKLTRFINNHISVSYTISSSNSFSFHVTHFRSLMPAVAPRYKGLRWCLDFGMTSLAWVRHASRLRPASPRFPA